MFCTFRVFLFFVILKQKIYKWAGDARPYGVERSCFAEPGPRSFIIHEKKTPEGVFFFLSFHRIADALDGAVEVGAVGDHQHRLGEVQREEPDEALGVHDYGAVFGSKGHILLALGG